MDPVPRTEDSNSLGSPEISDRERIQRELVPLIQAAVKTEEDRRFRQIKWIGAIVGIIGLGTFGTLANYAISTAVDTKVGDRTKQLSDDLEFLLLRMIALKMEIQPSFTDGEAKSIMTYLSKTKNRGGQSSADFLSALSQITVAFVQAGQTPQIDNIFFDFEREVLETPVLVEVLLHHYGTEIIGRFQTPKNDVAFSFFEKLERVAQAANVPELALFYKILFEYKRVSSHPDQNIVKMLEVSRLLQPKDQKRVLQELFTKTKAENWSGESTPSAKNIENLTRAFIDDYKVELERVFTIGQEAMARLAIAADTGLSGRDGSALATLIVDRL